MATVDSQDFVDRLIKGNGRVDPEESPDNPWCVKIVRYLNMNGKFAFGLVFKGDADPDRYEQETQFISEPAVIWQRA